MVFTMNEKLKAHILGKKHKFAHKVSKEELEKASAETRTVPMTFGSEYYVERWYGILVVNFSPECVKLDRWKQGAPYFMDHNSMDQRGIIRNGNLIDGILRGDVKFSQSERGMELFQDVMDEIRPYTSMGFDIHQIREMTPEEMPDDLKNICLENNVSAFKVDLWEPYEGSSVPLGANPTVGVEYDYFEGDEPETIMELSQEFGLNPERIEKLSVQFGFSKQEKNNSKPIITIKKEAAMADDVVKKTPEQLAQEKTARKAALVAYGKQHESRVNGGMPVIEQMATDIVEFYQDRETPEVESLFRGELFTKIKDKERLETPASFVGMTEKEKEQYSLMKVIRHVVGEPKPGEELGIEKEIHQQIIKNGGAQQKGGILIPFDFQSRKINFDAELLHLLNRNGIRTERFDQTVGSSSGGGYLVGTQNRPQDFIELYLNSLIQGLTYLPGLQQNIDIPKMTGGATITVAATEAAGFSETALTFGQLSLSPKEIGAYIEITRKLLVQSTPAIDNLVAIMLMKAMALKTNYLALYGSGGSGEPTGAFLTANIGTFDGASLGRAGVLNAMSDILSSNVSGPLQWLLSAATAEILMGRDQTSGYGQWLMNDNGRILTYPSQITEQMAANTLALAKLDEIVVGSFGTMEINYDRSTLSASGGLRIACYDLIDAGVKHPGGISYASSVS